MKRFIFGLFFVISLCALFSMQIVGALVKLFVKVKYDCELAYRSCRWEAGEFVFSDIVVFDPAFHAHIGKGALRIDWKALPSIQGHVTVDTPYVTIIDENALPDMEGGQFSCTINNGVLDWHGKVQFSLDYSPKYCQIALDWGDSEALISLQDEIWEARCDQFQLSKLNPWLSLGSIEGRASGHFAFNCDRQLLSANLNLSSGGLNFNQSALVGVDCNFSYNAGLGAKWELKGLGSSPGAHFPFTCTGRGFFQKNWLETKISFDESFCTISYDGKWNLTCDSICVCEIGLFQSVLGLFYPECNSWKLESGVLTGKAEFDQGKWQAQFEADRVKVHKGDYTLEIIQAIGALSDTGGQCQLAGPDYEVDWQGLWDDWSAIGSWSGVKMALRGGFDGQTFPITIEKGSFANFQFTGTGFLDKQLDGSFAIEGNCSFFDKEIPFYCPILNKQGKDYAFDFRFSRQTWDMFRLAGHYDGTRVDYFPTSHLLGEPLQFNLCPKEEIDLSLTLPWRSIQLLSSIFDVPYLNQMPQLESTDIHFQYNEERLELSAKGESPPFALHIAKLQQGWQFDLDSDLKLSALFQEGGFIKGDGRWKEQYATHFEGKVDPTLNVEVSLSDLFMDLQGIDLFPIEGSAQGSGHLIYNGQVDADFDLDLYSLKIHSYPLENQGPIHLFYSSTKGVQLSGLDVHGACDCTVDLLEYDDRSHWIFHNARVHIPASLFNEQFIDILDKDKDLDVTANWDIASDFSSFTCTMSEGSIPYKGADRHIEHLDLEWEAGKCKAALHYLDHPFTCHLQMGGELRGQVSVGSDDMPLTVDWTYSDALHIHSIEGNFSGIEASFHAEKPDVLVGSARLDFSQLRNILPEDVAEGFAKVEMGQGYELKGRLTLEDAVPSFQGLLSGKAIGFFGFQFRTLLAQVDLTPNRMRIFDVKISDSAGMLAIDEILFENHNPWTIQIPHLIIREMRPSLMQRPGGTVGPISPLVVRDLKMDDFKGILSDGTTYTATGKLHFINSYKREETVFDLPANVLSRIVGLDLELLIPVKGDLTFDLKGGYFNLLELTNAYSEADRSQFFLETYPIPRMDLDGNLQIFIKMKQFVLLKFTESFLISIDGVLDDPQFSLKRRRFFGLLE